MINNTNTTNIITRNSTAGTVGSSDGANLSCPCIDTSTTLASLTDRSCITSDGNDGVLLTVAGPCVAHDFGSSRCFAHELNVDLNCIVPENGNTSSIPDYCSRSWCYVDALKCMASYERVYRSQLFSVDSGVDVYYSYSTCGADPADWFESTHFALGSVKMKAITAAYNILPWVYKQNYDGMIPPVPGSEYYDNDLPYEGVHINFVNSLQAVSGGDFEVEYVHGSRASRKVHPSSPGTAAVQDVMDGLVDVAIGPIWITGGRLKMTSFTMPIHHDRTVLVIPKPGTKNSLLSQSEKVLDPFSIEVWFLLFATIIATALLSVWFNMGKRMKHKRGRVRKGVYARFCMDEFLQKGIFFCSAGVEQDDGASLPHKLLMFGFAFFTLILVSAYVANLAAFLTRTTYKYVGDIESVIASEMPICAHPAVQEDLELAHPDAKFVFNREGKELFGLVDDFKAGKCKVMAVGKMDSLGDLNLMDMFCKEELMYTESLIIESPVGFPIRADLASGFSYWMFQAEKYHGVSVQSSEDAYWAESKRKPTCNVLLSEQGDDEAGEFAQIEPANLFLPIMFFLLCAVIAVILQLYHQWVSKREEKKASQRSLLSSKRASMMGRVSTLNLFASNQDVHNPGPRRSKYDYSDSEEEEEKINEDVRVAVKDVENLGQEISQLANGHEPSSWCSTVAIMSGTFDTIGGKVITDNVQTDNDFNENDREYAISERKVGFLLNGSDLDEKYASNDSGLSRTLSQLNDDDVLNKLDDFVECYQTMKRRKKMISNHV